MAEPAGMFALGPDGKPDIVTTVCDLIKRLNQAVFRIEKIEMELATRKPAAPTDPSQFGMNGQQFDNYTREELPPPAPPPPARPAPAPAPASRDSEKEFWYKDDRGGSQTVFIYLDNPVCPLCRQLMDPARADNFGNPSLYCKSCRVYFNWSKHNDGGGRGARPPARRSGGGGRRW